MNRTQTAARGSSRRGAGLATASLLVSAALVSQFGVATGATWNDAETVHAALSTSDCAADGGGFSARGQGRVLSGELLGIPLDSVAQAQGAVASHDGSTPAHSPSTANSALPTGENAWANPLRVDLLGNAIGVDLGSGLLQLPLNNSTGVLSQYAQANKSGRAVGAGGYVSDSGGIGTSTNNVYPELATLKLSSLLSTLGQPVSSLVGTAANVELSVGAVTGRASLDGCTDLWKHDLADTLKREYLAASLNTGFTSPVVGQLVGAVNSTLTNTVTSVGNLASSSTLNGLLKNGVIGLLGNLLSGLGLADVTVTVHEITLDVSPLSSLLSTTIGDADRIVSIDLSSGRVNVDTVALLRKAYPLEYSNGLNGLPPNTSLFAPAQEEHALDVLGDAVLDAVNAWLGDVQDALDAQIGKIAVRLTVKLSLGLLSVVQLATVTAEVNGSLDALANNQGVNVTSTGLLDVVSPGLLGRIVTRLVNGLGATVAGVVRGAVLPLVPNLVATTTIVAKRMDLANAVSKVYQGLYFSGVVALGVNAQNRPLSGNAGPGEWSGLPPGQYDVAALRIGILDLLGTNNVNLYLGRGSVGPICSLAGSCVG